MRTPGFWQAWVYLFVMAAGSATIVAYLQRKDPKLLRRRIRGPGAEKEASQNLLQFLAILIFSGTVVLSSFDHRFSWSHVPLSVEIAGFAFVVLGFLIYFMVFRENTFAGATVEVASDQKVITTGPYASLRHPMYSGLLVLLFGTPLALGSWWGLLMVVPMALIVGLRVRYEEAFLTENLPGYVDYCRKLRYRLIPFIW
jgi:protein-S-isoprenylcysteine O-methyltransferase Ste14